MPWNSSGNNGGGNNPWGGSGGGPGGHNPWGRPSGNGGGGNNDNSGGPPDLEKLAQRARDFMSNLGGGGAPGRRGGGLGGTGKAIPLAILVVILLWGASGFYNVGQAEIGVVTRFGRFIGLTTPGLNYHLPFPIESVTTPVVTAINRIDLGIRPGGGSNDQESLMLTGDENIVDINFSVFWKVEDPERFVFNVRSPEDLVRMVAESSMREIIGQLPIVAPLSENREQIVQRTQQRMQELLNSYQAGIQVTQVNLTKADPPSEVIDAFNDVQRAKADQERAGNEAQAYQNDVVPRAQGDAQRIIQEAEAYKEQVVDIAKGEASRFVSVLNAYKAAPDVTARRLYIETMEDVMKSSSKVIVDPNLHGVVPYLPLPAPASPAPPVPAAPAPAPSTAPSPTPSITQGGSQR